jgi:hypothetical protein
MDHRRALHQPRSRKQIDLWMEVVRGQAVLISRSGPIGKNKGESRLVSAVYVSISQR